MARPNAHKPASARSGSVQSIQRAFTLLETMAAHGGVMGVSALAAALGLPPPTIHRLVRTLVDLGYLRQEPTRQYVLGPRLIPLGEASSQTLAFWARPHLAHLVDELGESANLATLDGDEILYLAQMPSRHSMRMFTEIGRRVSPHCTATGKALLAHMDTDAVRELLRRTGMPPRSPSTLTDPDELVRELVQTAARGYAIDEGEQEIGVRCVAVAVPGLPSRLALSVSGPAARMTEALVNRAVPLLHEIAARLSFDVRGTDLIADA